MYSNVQDAVICGSDVLAVLRVLCVAVCVSFCVCVSFIVLCVCRVGTLICRTKPGTLSDLVCHVCSSKVSSVSPPARCVLVCV